MSGPKVVRIVTKQEVMATCRGQINAVQDAIGQWRAFASKNDALSVDDERAVELRLDSINKMFEREQFSDVQKKCADEISALRADMIHIREAAIAKLAQERSKRRRIQYSAETLIKTFHAAGKQIPEELVNTNISAISANESELHAMSATLSRILTQYTLSSVVIDSMTPLQKELSKSLGEGEKLQTLVDWKIKYDGDSKSIDSDRRLDLLLAEIEAIENVSAAVPFLERVAIIAKEHAQGRRSLLTDSLILDLVDYTNERKVKDVAITSMRAIRSRLCSATSSSAKEVESLLTMAIDKEDISLSKILIDKGEVLLKEEDKIRSGVARREAILSGLTELGYEVRENMVTAWAENGRIIVKKPNEKSYGVELGAVEDAERVQVQLVTFEQSNDDISAANDLDRETIWCSEFYRLKSLLEKSGTALHIEKALPVGAKPLKKVQETTVHSGRTRKSVESIAKKKDLD